MSTIVLQAASLPDRAGRWDITLDGAVVRSVDPHGRSRVGARRVELDGGLVSRPFVDVHLHLDKAFQGDDVVNRSGSLEEAIQLSRRSSGRLPTEDELVARIVRGAMAALARGTTTLRSHIDVDRTVGLRGVEAALIARTMLPVGVRLEVVAFPQQGIDEVIVELLRQSLVLGCDAIGGIPARQPDARDHITRIFDLAAELDVPVDMHVDESDDPRDRTLELLADETERRGWQGRVIAGHCCSLTGQRPAVRRRIVEKVRGAGIHVVTLPSTNLHLQGRGDAVPRRGLAPVRELLEHGVNVVYGSDNIRDAFNPFGNASMVEAGLLLAHAAHMGGREDLPEVFEMATRRPAAALEGTVWSGTTGPHVTVGMTADILVFPVATAQDVIVSQSHPSAVYLSGVPVVQRREEVEVIGRPLVGPAGPLHRSEG